MANKDKAHLVCFLLFSFLVFLQLLIQGELAVGFGTSDGSEEWGYVEVRPGAHMFWWLYRSPRRVENSNQPWPIILWLQGGPGGSGVGVGNFQEIGPLDTYLQPRNSTWLQKADLLFVDNPVGTGYSFVENVNLLVRTDEESATDLTTLLKTLFNTNERLQKSPLFIVAESYGGKYAVTLGLCVIHAIQSGELKLKLGGVALGDSWISPEDYALSLGPLLKDVSRLDENGAKRANDLALKIKEQIQNEQYLEATNTWSALESEITYSSNDVDMYNFLLDDWHDPLTGDDETTVATTMQVPRQSMGTRYSRYLTEKKYKVDLDTFMNGVIRKKLQIIPNNVVWGGQSYMVFSALSGDFMKPRINEVDILLAKGVDVTVYNGQVDVICSTKGTESWVQQLKWEGLQNFNNLSRRDLYCGYRDDSTKAFVKSYKNFNFYWILGAGHFVPVDQPCMSLQMLDQILNSTNSFP